MSDIRTMKRSRTVALTTLTAASTLALQGCDEGYDAEGQVFSTVTECVSAGVPQSECQEAYSTALAEDNVTAPRFESRDLCEGEFGPGQCEPRVAGNNNFWVPLLAGFVIANAIDGIDIDRRKKRYAPLYRNRSTGTWYHGGSNYGPMTRTGSGYGFSRDALNRPMSAPRVQSRSDIASRGGFGGRARATSGG